MRFHKISTKLQLTIVSMMMVSLLSSQAFARSNLTADQAKACQDAEAERDNLNTRELRDLLGKKPREAAAGLNGEQLRNLRRLIELDEQVIFKCRLIAHPDLKKRQPGKPIISIPIPDLPVRKPKRAKDKSKQTVLLPLPIRKPK